MPQEVPAQNKNRLSTKKSIHHGGTEEIKASRSKREHPEDSKKRNPLEGGRIINRSSQPFIPSVVEPHLSASSEPSEVNLFCNGATRKTRAIYHTGC